MAGNARRGRPVGARNKEYATVHAQPVRCPSCGSTNLSAIKGAKPIEREIAGTAPDGVEYTATRWQRSQCDECGQVMVIISRLTEKNNTSDIISS